MKIAIASDHGGFELKKHLKSVLSAGNEIIDLGCDRADVKTDYPDYAVAAAGAITDGKADFSIMIDGAGVGSTMAANKIPGIRAALCNDLYCAENARAHNNANMLVMGSMVVGPGLAAKIAWKFLETAFEGGRHQSRIDKINNLDTGKRTGMDSETIKRLVSIIISKITGAGFRDIFPKSAEAAETFDGKVLTEEYLRKSGLTSIRISKKTIILPLAKDYIIRAGIKVEREN